jgi:hypothetical protein
MARHSRYTRALADLAISGRRVEIQLRVRRWRCLDRSCPARTFAEQVDGLTMRHARRTIALRHALEQVALALAGRAGARLCGWLAMPASRSSLLLPGRRPPSGPRILDPYADRLRRRWADGVTNATALFAEIRVLGYRGGYTTVQHQVRPWRAGQTPTAPRARPLSARRISSLLLRDPDSLDAAARRLAHRSRDRR